MKERWHGLVGENYVPLKPKVLWVSNSKNNSI